MSQLIPVSSRLDDVAIEIFVDVFTRRSRGGAHLPHRRHGPRSVRRVLHVLAHPRGHLRQQSPFVYHLDRFFLHPRRRHVHLSLRQMDAGVVFSSSGVLASSHLLSLAEAALRIESIRILVSFFFLLFLFILEQLRHGIDGGVGAHVRHTYLGGNDSMHRRHRQRHQRLDETSTSIPRRAGNDRQSSVAIASDVDHVVSALLGHRR